MELPVLSTYCSGIPELVEDGWYGILVRQRDSLQLSEAIRYLLENPL
jgi:glycosyltransferase involved in cell wall biosynthesis